MVSKYLVANGIIADRMLFLSLSGALGALGNPATIAGALASSDCRRNHGAYVLFATSPATSYP